MFIKLHNCIFLPTSLLAAAVQVSGALQALLCLLPILGGLVVERKRVEGQQGNWETKTDAAATNPLLSLSNSDVLPAFL